jgi:hypothetical protein
MKTFIYSVLAALAVVLAAPLQAQETTTVPVQERDQAQETSRTQSQLKTREQAGQGLQQRDQLQQRKQERDQSRKQLQSHQPQVGNSGSGRHGAAPRNQQRMSR